MRRATSFLLIATAACALLAGCSVGLPEGVIYPSITLDDTVTEAIPVEQSFTFEGQPVTIAIAVDGGLYVGAQEAEKSVTRFGNARENDWIEDYFPAFVDEEHQDGFYADVLTALRQVRDARGLDADRYAELMTVFVQSLTYRTDPVDLQPKFPVETFVEGAGDCDDKTLLLAALLAREGYDVAVLMFEPEAHVALGLRSDTNDYRGTGYAYVETTTFGFVGMVPDSFGGGVTLESEPRVFTIGDGTVRYTAGGQVAAILSARDRGIAEATALAPEIAAADAELARLQADVERMGDRMDGLQASGDTAGYNALVAEYNALIDAYNASAAGRNALADEHNALAALEATILEGLDDRPRVYAAVEAAF